MSWLGFLLVSVILSAIARVGQRLILTDKKTHPIAFAVLFQLIVGGMFALTTLVTDSFYLPDVRQLFPQLVLMTLLYSVANIALFVALKRTEASQVSIILALNTLVSVMSASVFLGESLGLLKLVGVVLVVVGVITSYYTKHQRWRLNSGHGLALVSAVCFGLGFTNDAALLNHYPDVASYLVLAFLLPGLLVGLTQLHHRHYLSYLMTPARLTRVILVSLVYAGTTLTLFSAYKSGGQASTISPLHQSSLVFTIILSYLLLREREQLGAKLLGSVVIIAGVFLLV